MQSAHLKWLPWKLLMRNNLLENETCPVFHRAGQNRPELHKSSSPNVTSCLTSLFSCAVKKWVGNAQQGNLDWVSVQMPTCLDAFSGIVETFGWSLEEEFLKRSGGGNRNKQNCVSIKEIRDEKRSKMHFLNLQINISFEWQMHDCYSQIVSFFYYVKIFFSNKSLWRLLLMLTFSRTIIIIIIIVKFNPQRFSWSSQTRLIIAHLNPFLFQKCTQASSETNGCRFSHGHSPLGANVRVGHTSFIHGDGRHFASSRAISESIKKSYQFWKDWKKKKIVGAINHRGRLPDADRSLTYWQHLSAPYPKSPSRLQQNPFPHMAARKITAGDTLLHILRPQMRCIKRIINIVLYIYLYIHIYAYIIFLEGMI